MLVHAGRDARHPQRHAWRGQSGDADVHTATQSAGAEFPVSTADGDGAEIDLTLAGIGAVYGSDRVEEVEPGPVVYNGPSFSYENVQVFEKDDWVGLSISSLNEAPPKGNILFGFDEKLDSENSLLLNEHYKGTQPFEGFRYGIRYDQNEIGLYDYSTNYLMAKYIWGITPSDDYYNKDENKIFIKFKKDIVTQLLNKSQKFKILTE